MAANPKKNRNWCFTINNWELLSTHLLNDVKARLSAAKYWVMGREVSPSTGTKHLQGFVQYHNAVYFNGVKKDLEGTGAHIEPCKGTALQNMDYCKKDGDFEEHGEPPMSQKRKGEVGAAATQAKWRKLYDLAKEGKNTEIGEEFPREAIVCVNHIQKVRESFIGNKTKNLAGCCGLWLEGKSNAGKTHLATTMFPGAYEKKANKWWCRYNDQEVVIINDVSPFQKKDITDHLKIWADKYPFPVETKGGGMQGLRPRKIVVTSQYTIDEVWEDAETREAMHRRFKERHVEFDPAVARRNRNPNDLSDDEVQAWASDEEEDEVVEVVEVSDDEVQCTQLDLNVSDLEL
jgi:hypothetical protein